MLVDPRAAFRRDESAAPHVRGGRRELRHENVPRRIEHLGFGDVGGGVEVQKVRRRAVRLVARLRAEPVRPFRPAREVLHDHVGNRLAVVVLDASDGVGVADAGEFGVVVFQRVPAQPPERGGKFRRPRRFVVGVGIVVEAPRTHRARTRERAVERLEEGAHRLLRARVDHDALPRFGGLVDLPAGRRGLEANLASVRVLPAPQHLAAGKRRVVRPQPVEIPHAEAAGDVRAAEVPPAPGRHVRAEPLRRPFRLRDGEEPHPFIGEIVDRRTLFVDGLVDRDDVDAAQPRVGQLLRLKVQAGLVDGAAHPPVVAPRAHRRRDLRPRRLLRERRHGAKRQRRKRLYLSHNFSFQASSAAEGAITSRPAPYPCASLFPAQASCRRRQ